MEMETPYTNVQGKLFYSLSNATGHEILIDCSELKFQERKYASFDKKGVELLVE